jgi:hypothetical protein
MMLCNINGCDARVVAKGLCAKHYMRARRHGSPDKKHKPGPKRREYRQMFRPMLGEWSPRTQARWLLAQKLVPSKELQKLIKRASRPNGSLNVSRLLEMAAVRFVLKNKDRFRE